MLALKTTGFLLPRADMITPDSMEPTMLAREIKPTFFPNESVKWQILADENHGVHIRIFLK